MKQEDQQRFKQPCSSMLVRVSPQPSRALDAQSRHTQCLTWRRKMSILRDPPTPKHILQDCSSIPASLQLPWPSSVDPPIIPPAHRPEFFLCNNSPRLITRVSPLPSFIGRYPPSPLCLLSMRSERRSKCIHICPFCTFFGT